MRVCNGSWLVLRATDLAKGDIKIGNMAPNNGPASAYSSCAKARLAYMIHDKGGRDKGSRAINVEQDRFRPGSAEKPQPAAAAKRRS